MTRKPPKDPTAAERQRRKRLRDAEAKAALPAVTDTGVTLPAVIDPVTPTVTLAKPLERENPCPGSTWPQSHANSHGPLVVVAYGFALVEVAINVKNAWGGALVDVAIPASLGVLAACVMLWLPSWAKTLPFGQRVGAFVLLGFLVWPFAFMNNLRMASIVTADVTMARADRQTTRTENAKTDLDRAKDAQDKACAPGQGKSKACQLRQTDVAEAKVASKDAQSKVAEAAKPESVDFAKLVKRGSFGYVEPSADDFDMLMLLLRTLLPQIGGLLLMLARQ
jgi:hypothetical protein